jgi:hypothetical protein
MKKFTFLLSLMALSSTVLFSQLKVLSNGKVAIRSSTSNYGDVQINIGNGDNAGLCFFNTDWNNPALKITSDPYFTYLLDGNNPTRGIGFFYGSVNIGEKSNMGDSDGGSLNINQSATSYGDLPYGLCVNTYTGSGIGIVSKQNNSIESGISIYSTVYRNASLTFASGTNFSTNFYVLGNGNAYTNGILVASDSTLKTDIKTIQSPMQKIMNMHGVSYKYKVNAVDSPTNETITSTVSEERNTDNTHKTKKIEVPKLDQTIMKKIEDEDKNLGHIGFLAQEMEKVIPEVVRTTVNGTKAIAYTDLIAILVEGMKEQQVTIDKLNQRLTNLESTPISKVSKIISDNTDIPNKTDALTYPVLDQNVPNPFNQSTTIGFYLPTTVTNANIYVYDMNGIQLKNYSISERGKENLVIQGSEFNAGMYLYALIADGKVIDTKRMILTK